MKQNDMIRNDTGVAVVDFKSAEEESESSYESELAISKAKSCSRNRSCLFQKSGVGIRVEVTIFELRIWESDSES